MVDWISTDQFLVIGHRGVPSVKPENTLGSFARALELGAAGIEFDVHRVGDQLVVIHDDKVDRTTDGFGKVSDFALEELRNLDAGEEQQIPLLHEVLALVDDHHLVNIELKGDHTGELLANFLEVNKKHQHQVLVSSFNSAELTEFSRTCPAVRVGVLSKTLDRNAIQLAKKTRAYSMHLSNRGARVSDITKIRDMGIRVMVYTVNDVDRAAELRELNVFGVFTDESQNLIQLQTV